MFEGLTRKLRALMRRDEMNADLDREMEYHLDRLTELNVKAGMSRDEARAAARRDFGGVEQSKEQCRDARGVRWLDDFVRDVRFGSRTLATRPAFTAVALFTLALGIGANSAIFSVIDAVLLRPLPFQEPERVVMVWERVASQNGRNNVTSIANYSDWRDQSTSFEHLVAFVTWQGNLTGGGEPERLNVQLVAPGFFDMLGTPPLLGRALTPDDDEADAPDAVVLSHALWQRRFAGDPEIVGKAISLDGTPQVVGGVMPRDFRLTINEMTNVTGNADVWVPMRLWQNKNVRGRYLQVAGKLKPGVTVDAAQREMDYLAARLEAQYPQFNTGRGVRVVPIREQLVGKVRPALLMLSGAVALVLLISCANVANLLLMRAATRRREIAIRAALGAGRLRVIRQLLTESLCLSLLGGLLGLLLALWGTDLLLALAPPDLLGVTNVGINLRVLGFTAFVSLLTGLVFGLVPAIQASKVNLNSTLNEGGRHASADRAAARLSNVLVVSEVAVAVVLLIGAGLLLRSFSGIRSVDPGFSPEGVATARLQLPREKYEENSEHIAFYNTLLERARALPGVTSASAVSWLPFSGVGSNTRLDIEGRPVPEPSQAPGTDVAIIDPSYFETMKIPILEGRTFTSQEARVASHVIIVNQALAREHFPGESALGKRIKVHMMREPEFCEIVGVVADIRQRSLEAPVNAGIYWPHSELVPSGMTLVARGDGDPSALLPLLREAVREMDPDLPLSQARTMESWMADSLAQYRFTSMLLAIFGAVAFILAVVGIYGVLSYAVTLRTNEIGIRMALGAQRDDVLRMVLADGLRLCVLGLAIGLVAAVLLNRYIASLLFGVAGTDVITYAGASLLFLAVATLACTVPARRAVSVDPMVALR